MIRELYKPTFFDKQYFHCIVGQINFEYRYLWKKFLCVGDWLKNNDSKNIRKFMEESIIVLKKSVELLKEFRKHVDKEIFYHHYRLFLSGVI